MIRHALTLAGVLAACSALSAAEVGPAVAAAPQAKGTRNQTWASAAWCEGAKCWLAVWREGYLNEQKGEIWCARISAGGQSLDPAGVRLTPGEAFRDRPRVASDGKKLLVVWEEVAAGASLSPGSDGRNWDVRAVTVSADGGLSAGKPFTLAGGSHNQCRPDVAFAKGSYHVLYMGYENGVYGIYGTRVTAEGKPAGDKPAVVAAVSGKPDNPVNVTLPAVAANAEGELLTAFLVRDIYRLTYVGRRPLDAATGQACGAAPANARDPKSPGGRGWGGRERTPALAMGPDGAISVSTVETTRSPNDIVIGSLSKSGDVLGLEEAGAGALGINDPFKPISARFAVAFTGKAYLAVGEVLSNTGGKKDGSAGRFVRVIGWRITTEGKADGEAFAVAGEAGRECLLPSVAAGPDGSSLVLYSEVRGADDVKVVGKTVK